MSNIKLHPEDSIFVPGKGFEKALAEIIQEYIAVLEKRGFDTPLSVKAYSRYNKDFEQALDDAYDYISKAANDGDIDAEKTLIKIEAILDYDFPNYFVIQGEVEANISVAKFGDIYSQGMLGDRFYYGKGVKQNYEKAFQWYKLSAEQGVKQAQYNLAGCYEMGRGVIQDMGKALEWYMKAADRGFREAKRAVKRFELQKKDPERDLLTYMPTYIWEGERENSWKDDFGVVYSADGRRLLDAPEDLTDYSIKKGTQVICDGAFGTKLTSITIPEGVVVIGNHVFSGCSKLKAVSLPNSLREIGDKAFCSTGLINITIPEGVETIGIRAFRECTHLKSIRISKSVAEIGKEMFVWSKNLESIIIDPENDSYDSRDNCNAIIETRTNTLISGCYKTVIPDSVSAIGNEAFWGCDNMTTIEIPNGVESIGRMAFFKCKNLQHVIMADSVKKIGFKAFYECGKLKSVKLSKGLEKIDGRAFQECYSLESADLPDGLKSIGRHAFWRCEKLNKLVIPDSVTTIHNSAFCNCSRLNAITISRSVKKIGDYAFCGCYGISSVIIPDSVIIIGKYAFCNCDSLTSLIIPKSVKLIEEGAFEGCDGLDVTILNEDVEVQTSEDNGINQRNGVFSLDHLVKTNLKKPKE